MARKGSEMIREMIRETLWAIAILAFAFADVILLYLFAL